MQTKVRGTPRSEKIADSSLFFSYKDSSYLGIHGRKAAEEFQQKSAKIFDMSSGIRNERNGHSDSEGRS